MSGGLFILGVLLIFVGFITIMLNLVLALTNKVGVGEGRKSKIRSGEVVIVNPVPIIFGSDKKSTLIFGIVGALITVLLLVTMYIPSRMRFGWRV